MRLRKRAAGLALGAGILFLLGTNVQAGWLFVLCALMLGTLVSGLVLPGRMLRGIELERRAPAEVVQGEDAFVDLIVTNRARGIRLGLTLDDAARGPDEPVPHEDRPGRARRAGHRAPGAPSGACRRTPWSRCVPRRRSASPNGAARSGWPAARSCCRPSSPSARCRSWPTPPIRAARPVPSRTAGPGPEYLGIREYRPGDSPRHVHWPSTARTGTVMVRELEEERSRRVAIVVDTLADVGDIGTPLDACCTVAASIARVAIADGHGIRTVAVPAGRSVEVWDDVDEGPLRRRLAALVPDGVPLAETLDRAAEAFRDVDVVVLIFPTWRTNADEALARAVSGLAATRASVVAVPVEVGPTTRNGSRRCGRTRPSRSSRRSPEPVPTSSRGSRGSRSRTRSTREPVMSP